MGAVYRVAFKAISRELPQRLCWGSDINCTKTWGISHCLGSVNQSEHWRRTTLPPSPAPARRAAPAVRHRVWRGARGCSEPRRCAELGRRCWCGTGWCPAPLVGAEQLKPLLSSSISTSPCSGFLLSRKSPARRSVGSNLCYPQTLKAADRDNSTELLPEPPLSCQTPPGCCRAGIPNPHPESEEEKIHPSDGLCTVGEERWLDPPTGMRWGWGSPVSTGALGKEAGSGFHSLNLSAVSI